MIPIHPSCSYKSRINPLFFPCPNHHLDPCAFTTTALSSRQSSTSTTLSSTSTNTNSELTETNNSKDNISIQNSDNSNNNDGDDDEWEYVEFERLTESDLANSEWLIGTCWDSRPGTIDETWCRLAVVNNNKDGSNVAIWGDSSQGKWSLDVAAQYVTISKTKPWGKQIWACLVEDYYYMRGTVRGWNFWSAAAVEGQWQAKRLGVGEDEAGVAPWFQDVEEGDDDDDQDDNVNKAE